MPGESDEPPATQFQVMQDDAVNAGSPTPVLVPVLGRIAAGGPILAEQLVEEVFPLPRTLVGEGTLYMLRVQGDSMVDAAIADGDWVVVRQQPDAENGDIVAAMIDGEATVKTFRRRDGHAWLLPQNPAYSPIPATTPASSAEPAPPRRARSRRMSARPGSRSRAPAYRG